MDPQIPPNQAPTNDRKKLIFGIVGAALVIIGLIVWLLISLQNQEPSGEKVQRVQRNGYENVPASVADPDPLIEEPNANVVKFKDEIVITACSILDLKDLKKLNAYLSPNPDQGLERTYFDGAGAKDLPLDDSLSLPLEDNNNCTYRLQNNDFITLTVYQPSYTNSQALQRQLNRLYTPQSDITGVKVFSKNAEGSTDNSQSFDYYLQKGAVTVRLSFTIAKNDETQQLKQKILDTTVAGLFKPPTGPSNLTYQSAAFSKSFANACTVQTTNDFSQLFKLEAAPVVKETFGTAIGVINFSKGTQIKDANEYAYITHRCARNSVAVASNGRHKSLTVQTKSYSSDQAAKHEIELSREKDGAEATASVIADDSYVVTKEVTKAKGAIVFRKGRIVTEVTMSDPTQPSKQVDATSRGQLLLPTAQSVANHIIE